jgi:hypothetical protein
MRWLGPMSAGLVLPAGRLASACLAIVIPETSLSNYYHKRIDFD